MLGLLYCNHTKGNNKTNLTPFERMYKMKNNHIKTRLIAAALAGITITSAFGAMSITCASAAERTQAVTESDKRSADEIANEIRRIEETRQRMQETTIPAATAATAPAKTEQQKAQDKKAKEEEERKKKENRKINDKEAREQMIIDTALEITENLLKSYIGDAYDKVAGKSHLAKILKKKGEGIVGKLTDSSKDHKLSKDTQAILESVTKLENLMSDNQEQTARGMEAILDAIKNSRFKNVYSDLENDYNNNFKQVSFVARQLGNMRAGYETKESAANIKARLSTHDPHKMTRLFSSFYSELNKETVTVNGEKHSAALEQYIKNRFSELRRKDDHIFSKDSADYDRLRKEINSELELMAQLCINDYSVIKLYLQAYKEIVGVTDTVQTKAALNAVEQNLDSDFSRVIDYLDKSYLSEDVIKAEVTVNGLTKGYLSFADAFSAAFSAKKAVLKVSENVTADEVKGLNSNNVSAGKGFNGSKGLLINDKKDVTIDFGGKTIDCLDKGITVFTVSPDCKLTLKNGTFKNVEALISYRSDKAVSTELKLENIKVINSNKSAVQISDKSKHAKFVFEKCTFENVKDGAGIFADEINAKNVTVNNCTFVNCHNKEAGGAISLNANGLGKYLTVTNSVFKNNVSDKSGGALLFAEVKNCRFTGNKANDNGGAISIACKVENCQFENNSTKWYGGAIAYARDHVKNSTFINNSGYYGGAVYATTNVNFENITLSRNSAKSCGGGLYLKNTGSVIDGLTCDSNKAGVYGGAVAVSSDELTKTYVMRNASFIYNHAGKNGGAVVGSTLAFNSVNIKLEGVIKAYHNTAGEQEKASDFLLEDGVFTKSKLSTTDKFNSKDSIVNVASDTDSEIAVCELNNAAHKSAFSSTQGRKLYTGSFYTKTLYLGKA